MCSGPAARGSDEIVDGDVAGSMPRSGAGARAPVVGLGEVDDGGAVSEGEERLLERREVRRLALEPMDEHEEVAGDARALGVRQRGLQLRLHAVWRMATPLDFRVSMVASRCRRSGRAKVHRKAHR